MRSRATSPRTLLGAVHSSGRCSGSATGPTVAPMCLSRSASEKLLMASAEKARAQHGHQAHVMRRSGSRADTVEETPLQLASVGTSKSAERESSIEELLREEAASDVRARHRHGPSPPRRPFGCLPARARHAPRAPLSSLSLALFRIAPDRAAAAGCRACARSPIPTSAYGGASSASSTLRTWASCCRGRITASGCRRSSQSSGMPRGRPGRSARRWRSPTGRAPS